MRQDFFEFTPQFKIILAGNHKPGLYSVDDAIRRRFNLLPFTVTVPESERDSKLMAKLQAERSGILGWMISGCLEWQSEGLQAPQVVSDATAKYLAAEDVLARWIEDRCHLGKTHWAPAARLFEDWRKWCDENQEDAGSQKRFSENLESRGHSPKRTSVARGFNGISLMTDMTGQMVIVSTCERA